MSFTKALIIVACLALTMHAMEDEIKPCSEEEHLRFFTEFWNMGCNYQCRAEQLEELAEKFDAKKDGHYLRALLCADRSSASNRYRAQINFQHAYGLEAAEKIATRNDFISHGQDDDYWIYSPKLKFIDKAVSKGNIDFLKVFFGLFGSLPTKVVYGSLDFVHELYVNQRDVIRDREMSELIFFRYINPSPEIIDACIDGTDYLYLTAGCGIVEKKYQQDTEAALQAAAQQEQKKHAWEQSLREVGK